MDKIGSKFEWQDGRYIMVDGIFCEVLHKRNNVYNCKKIGSDEIFYIVTDGIKYSHGTTIKEAREDLLYKIGNVDKSKYEGLSIESELTFVDAVECYRVVTGACSLGVKDFVKTKGISTDGMFKIGEIIKLTEGSYGSDKFKSFFGYIDFYS
jgi:hypothetical protein